MKTLWTASLLVLSLLLPPLLADDSSLTVVTPQGQKLTLTGWKFLHGTRTIPGFANGVELLEFREDHSTQYVEGVLTLIPRPSLRQLDYEADKKVVHAHVASAGGKDVVLTGPTKYLGLNKVTLEAEQDLGPLGVAIVKYKAGLNEGGLKQVRLPSPQPVPELPKGRVAKIVVQDKDKSSFVVVDPVPYYLAGSTHKFPGEVTFRDNKKVDWARVQKLRKLELANKKAPSPGYEVTYVDGKQETLLPPELPKNPDKAGSKFLGLLGRVPAGYQLVPLHTISELSFSK